MFSELNEKAVCEAVAEEASLWQERCKQFLHSDAMVSVRDALMGHYPKKDALAKLDELQKSFEKLINEDT